MIHLILGGEKSGKSDCALSLARKGKGPVLFVATGKPVDTGFRKQILRHRVERGPEIPVREISVELPEVIEKSCPEYGCILVDSLDFWLYACQRVGHMEERTAALLDILGKAGKTDVILVSCEIGLGPVAADAATRAFVRGLGGLNRKLASMADDVRLVVAGRSLSLPE